jgi:Periplasmic glucan biosynthesis protein, MdoG
MQDLRQVSANISRTVIEQELLTGNIAGLVSRTSDNTRTVSESIAEVNIAASRTSDLSRQVHDHASEIAARLAEMLHETTPRLQQLGKGGSGSYCRLAGMALDTGLPSGEEFPSFVEFWLLRPPPDAREMQLSALLDGPSATGAYAFTIIPGTTTTVAVRARLFARNPLNLPGLAWLRELSLKKGPAALTVRELGGVTRDSESLEWRRQAVWRADRDMLGGVAPQRPQGIALPDICPGP